MATRRPRRLGEPTIALAHALVPLAGNWGAASWETDRARFIGRGRTGRHPAALDGGALSGTVGGVLDPVLALRRAVVLAPGEEARVAAVYVAAPPDALDAPLAALSDPAALARLVDAVPLPGERRHVWDVERVADASRPVPAPDAGPKGDPGALEEFNGYGAFATGGAEYVIRVEPAAGRWPPLPWVNVIANERLGCIVSESGACHTWAGNSQLNRLTPWSNDPVTDPAGEALFLRDEETGACWSPTPGPMPGPGAYEVRHGFGSTRFAYRGGGLDHELTVFVAEQDPARLGLLRLTNRGDRPRRVALYSYVEWVLGVRREQSAPHIRTEYAAARAILATNAQPGVFAGRTALAALLAPFGVDPDYTSDRLAFLGEYGDITRPAAVVAGGPLGGRTGRGMDPCAAFRAVFLIPPRGTVECVTFLAQGEGRDALGLLLEYRKPGAVAAALARAQESWRRRVTAIQVTTPVPALDVMVNGWLVYQDLSCRILARSAFYQSGGALGYRDQLQDAVALVALDPALTRRQILLHAAHQFAEGDVLHWWHPPDSRGIRTRCSDDLLWLPWAAAQYVAATGDQALLDEEARFISGPAVPEGEDELFMVPHEAAERASVYAHCARALERSLGMMGAHGLPLIGTGDWNDGMNRVGREGRGESTWLGFFLHATLGGFKALAERRGDSEWVRRCTHERRLLAQALDAAGWDGRWYRRAWYDDGTVLGSSGEEECRIDAIAQAWAVLSGVASPERAARALDSLEELLVSEADGIIRLLTPPFDRTPHDPGYIRGYLPGIRENGGQYTHGTLWAVRALAQLGRTERAARLLAMLSPASHARTQADADRYKVEPYVVAADVYGAPPHVGRGGWTWYTGSAGWMHRVAVESILGFELREGREARLCPCIPRAWPGYRLRYRVPGREATLEIEVTRAGGATSVRGEGARVDDGAVLIPLPRQGTRRVVVELGDDVGPRYAQATP